MTLAIILVIAAILSLALILATASSSRSLQRSGDSKSALRIQPLDIEAFRNLTNPADDEFLRAHLRPMQFRAVRRARLRATAAYVLQAGRNAVVLVRIGQGALASTDPRTQQAAHELINDALRLRRNAAVAVLRIYIAFAWPHAGLAATGIADRYEHLSGSAMLLGRLQNPAVAVRLASSK